MFQVIWKLCSSDGTKSKVRSLVGVRFGIILLSLFRSTSPAAWLAWQSKNECSRVSVAGPVHLVQLGDLLGRILETLSAVGRIL